MWEPKHVAGRGQGEHTPGSLPHKTNPEGSSSVFSASLRPSLLQQSSWRRSTPSQVLTPVLTHFPTGEVGTTEIRAKQEEKSAV